MTNVIEGLAKKIDNVPAELLEDAIKAFTVIAERHGGKMFGGRYQLTAKPDRIVRRGEQASVVMRGATTVGEGTGFWVWKESGTKAHLIRPKRRKKPGWKPGPLGMPGHPVWGPVMHPGTSGSLKWTKTCIDAEKAIADLVERGVEKAVR